MCQWFSPKRKKKKKSSMEKLREKDGGSAGPLVELCAVPVLMLGVSLHSTHLQNKGSYLFLASDVGNGKRLGINPLCVL